MRNVRPILSEDQARALTELAEARILEHGIIPRERRTNEAELLAGAVARIKDALANAKG